MKNNPHGKKQLLFLPLLLLAMSLSSCFTEGYGQFTLFVISNDGNFTGNYLIDGEVENFKFFEGSLYSDDSTYYIYEEEIDFNSIDISVTKENAAGSVEIIIYQGDYQVAKEEIEEYQCASYDSDDETCLTYTDTTSLYYQYSGETDTVTETTE